MAEIADRIAVMFHGRLSAPLESGRSDAREARIADGRREPRAAGGGARMKLISRRSTPARNLTSLMLVHVANLGMDVVRGPGAIRRACYASIIFFGH